MLLIKLKPLNLLLPFQAETRFIFACCSFFFAGPNLRSGPDLCIGPYQPIDRCVPTFRYVPTGTYVRTVRYVRIVRKVPFASEASIDLLALQASRAARLRMQCMRSMLA